MPEVLSELVAKIIVDAQNLKQGLAEGERATEASSKRMADSLKKVGTAMAASGAAITAALGLMGKAAIDEDVNIKRLAISLKNVGVNYDDVKDSLEGVISATQRKTGIADNEQRDALNELITVTGSYDTAIKWLQPSLDMAAAKQMDATSAARLLGRAAIGSTDMLTRYGIIIKKDATAAEVLTEVQKKFGGAAEATANPLNILSAAMGDVAETIGANLLPVVKPLIDKIVDITIKIQDWTKAHPALARVLTLVALGVGALLTVIGGLILAMPTIIALVSAFGVVFHVALGPIGLISLAIMALIAIGILLWKNWNKVTSFFIAAWTNTKIAVLTAIDFILGALDRLYGFIPILGKKIKEARENVRNLIDKEKLAKDIKDTQQNLENLTQKVKGEFAKQAQEIQASYDKQKRAAQSAHDAAVEAINKEYGIAKATSENRIEAAKRATEEAKESYRRETDAAKTRYDTEMEQIRSVYNAKMETLNLETDATIKALQDQIDAIDNQTKGEELAATRAEEAKRMAELKGAYDSAKTAEEKAKAKGEWEKYAADVARRELLRQRDDEKNVLRQQIVEARTRADARRVQIKAEEDTALASLKTKFDAEISTLNQLAERADGDLKDTLARIEQDRVAKIDAEAAKLNAEIARLDKAELEEVQFYTDQLKRANQQVKEINVAYDSLQKRYDIEIVTHQRTIREGVPDKQGLEKALDFSRGLQGFASGGIVPGPRGMPQLAMVHGGETILPEDSTWGGTININIDSFTANSARDVDNLAEKIVRLIRTRTGIK